MVIRERNPWFQLRIFSDLQIVNELLTEEKIMCKVLVRARGATMDNFDLQKLLLVGCPTFTDIYLFKIQLHDVLLRTIAQNISPCA